MSCSARSGPHPRARLALHARSLLSRGLRTLAASGPLAPTSPIGKATSGAFGSREARDVGARAEHDRQPLRALLIPIRHALVVTSPVLSPARIRRCLAGGAGAGGRAGMSPGPRGGGRGGGGGPRRGPDLAAPGAQQLGPTEGAGVRARGWSHHRLSENDTQSVN